MTQARSNPFLIYLLWIIATTIGWLAGLFNLDSNVKTYMDVVRLLPVYLANGLLIGLVAGVGQAFVLKWQTGFSRNWIWASTISYGLTFLGGLIISVLIPSMVWLSKGDYLLPVSEPASVSMIVNRDDIFWGGFLLGSIQWPVLKKIIPTPNRNKALLWVLVNWFALGASVFVRAFTYQTALEAFEMSLIGTVMGIITGWILLIFFSKPDSAK